MSDPELLRQAWINSLGNWRKVANNIGITPQHLSRIKTGKSPMTDKIRWKLNKLAFGYNMTQTDGGKSTITLTAPK